MGTNDRITEFPPVSSKQWKQQIQYELQGADYNKELVWESPEGIRVKPFYTREDLENQLPPPERQDMGWKIAEAITVGHSAEANAAARDALQAGSESLFFKFTSSEISWPDLLKGIDGEKVALHLKPADYREGTLENLVPGNRGFTSVYIHADPIGHLAQTGNWTVSMEADIRALDSLCEKTAAAEGWHPFVVDGSIYQNAGANHVQQLAYCLAHAHEYLILLGGGRPSPTVFTLAAGRNYFFEIAKFRALRHLWKTLANEYGVPGTCHVVGIPSLRNKTIFDYNNNLVRTSAECMSAILGGADTVINLPYDFLYKHPNPFSARLARNQLLILKNESNFGEVASAVDGTYYLETLTRQLAEKALELFRQIEAGGGFLKQLKEHQIQKKIREAAQREQKLFDEGLLAVLGVNAQRQPEDRMKAMVEFPIGQSTNKTKTSIEPILQKRLAAAREINRLGHE